MYCLPQDADIVVLEFTANDKRDAPYADPERKGYEQLVRKLLNMPGRPALLQLHHYAWWHAVGERIEDGGLFYSPAGEAQLSVFAHYYDFPALSVRAAMWPLMQARVNQFNVSWRGQRCCVCVPACAPARVLVIVVCPSANAWWEHSAYARPASSTR